MLGRTSPQGELFRPDHLLAQHVGEDSFHVFLAQARHEHFRDEDFAGLYRDDWGRPSVPPSQLCVALILQALDGVSDEEAINRTAYDIRWKVALGLELEEKLCAKSTLQLFRAKLVLHDRYSDIFDRSVEACRKAGLLKRKKLEVAIDTTPVLGRGAVKDTFNLISDQIRRVVEEVVALKGCAQDDLVAEHGLGRHFKKSFKGAVELDWGDPKERRALLGQLVADARVALELCKKALNGFSRRSEKARSLREAQALLSDLLLQDVDEAPEDGQGPQIKRGTSRDRTVSTTDPQMRHGRKSHSTSFEGYKATIVAETEDGVILETGVRPANSHDSAGARQSVESAAHRAGNDVIRVLGDTAYGGLETRTEIESTGAELVAKAPPIPRSRGCYSVDDFKIDKARSVARCPAGKKSIRMEKRTNPLGWRFVFSRNDCRPCPLRSRCTKAKVGARMVQLTEVTEAQRVHRRRQKTKAFKRTYRRRMVVEHRIARLVQLGARQARYLGQAKVAFQIAIAAAAANLWAAMGAFLPLKTLLCFERCSKWQFCAA
jgi:transposase/IS5 family transposase